MSYTLGAADVFDAFVYGPQNPNTVSYLKNSASQWSNTLTEAGQQWMQKGKEIFNVINSSEAMNLARKAINSVKGIFGNNTIREIVEMSDFQSASLTMQRWIMAQPDVRNLYHKNRCDGYSGSYVDVEFGFVGNNHYDYRRVMDGVFQDDEKEGWVVRHYLEELKPDDRHLTHHEKIDIIRTWDSVAALIAMGEEDPTSDVMADL
jgi:hypothetical protein